MSDKVLYTAEATVTGGRIEGHGKTSDGALEVDIRIPSELGGPGGGTNPEQLFAAGYAGCFHNALLLVARGQKIDISDSAVTAYIGLGDNGKGGFGISAKLHVEIPGLDQAKAEELVATAESVCPYSNATRGNVDLELEVTTGD
jgi:lipoyl-dependent peroxiredoxin